MKNITFKFKDGITITCIDSDNKDFKEVRQEALKVHKQMQIQNKIQDANASLDGLTIADLEKDPSILLWFYITAEDLNDLDMTEDKFKKLAAEYGFNKGGESKPNSVNKEDDGLVITAHYSDLKKFIEEGLDVEIESALDRLAKVEYTMPGLPSIENLPLAEQITQLTEYLAALKENGKDNLSDYKRAERQLAAAKKALAKQTKDSTTVRKFNVNNGTHAPRTIKTLIKNGDEAALKKEFFHLKRDIEADLKNTDYQEMYTVKQLKEIVNTYNELIDVFETCEIESITSELADLKEKVNTIKSDVFELKDSIRERANAKDAKKVNDVPFEEPTVSISTDFRFSKDKLEHYGRHKDRDALLLYYPDVIEDIEEDLADPNRVKKFRKDELRTVVKAYRDVIKAYNEAELFEEAANLTEMVEKLSKKVWHLEV